MSVLYENDAFSILVKNGTHVFWKRFSFSRKSVSKLKVDHVVNLKLAFTDWFFCNLIILIRLCKIRYLNLDKALLFPGNQVIFLKKWQLWRDPTTIKFKYFFTEILHTFLTQQRLQKGVWDVFLFCLDIELLMKI